MSGGSDNLLSRWSRRKLAARSSEALTTDEKEHAPGETAQEIEASGPALQPDVPETMATELDAAENSEPLPRIEDLTAESDLTAFLKKGVPLALKSAAMRKMWSLNPAIRDYIGPAEYAWDFNQPGSMAGFGPLDTKESVVNFLSRTVNEIETDIDELADSPGAQPATDTEQHAGTSSGGEPDSDTAEPPEAVETVRSGSREQPPARPAQESADARPAAEPANPTDAIARPRHGGALPR